VTGLLKLYFRELRNPLMTYEYYDWFIEAASKFFFFFFFFFWFYIKKTIIYKYVIYIGIDDYEERMYQIKSIIHSLPRANYVVLECLVRHLNLVATYSDVNKMEASNLALIFSVGLLRSPQEDFSSIMMSDLQSKIMEAMIQQVDWFFEEDEEDLNEVVEQST
jgi:hypothetical protein